MEFKIGVQHEYLRMQWYKHHNQKQSCSPTDEKYVESTRGASNIQFIQEHNSTNRSYIEDGWHDQSKGAAAQIHNASVTQKRTVKFKANLG